jgi:hypothetical protein
MCLKWLNKRAEIIIGKITLFQPQSSLEDSFRFRPISNSFDFFFFFQSKVISYQETSSEYTAEK